MWYEWLLRQCDMGALAAGSALQQPLDNPSSDNTNTSSDASLLNRRKAARREPVPHIFPPPPLSGPPLLPSDLVSPPSCVVWSPLFEQSPGKESSYQTSGGLKVLSSNLFAENEPPPGWTTEQQALNHLARKYLQTSQELKSSCTRCTIANEGNATPTTSGESNSQVPWDLQPSYAELKAGFWKRLAEPRYSCSQDKKQNASFSEKMEDGDCLREPLQRKESAKEREGIERGRVIERKSSVEIQVVLSGKRTGDADESCTATHPKGLGCQSPPLRNGEEGVSFVNQKDNQKASVNDFSGDKDHDGEICRTGASSRENSDGEKESIVGVGEGDGQMRDSGCSVGSGGIGRGRLAEDGSPMSVEIVREPWEGRPSNNGVHCNGKGDDGDIITRNSSNWCTVDSYITGHGKETTWTVRGFEEDDGIFEESSLDCKDQGSMRLLAHKLSSHGEVLIQGLALEGPQVVTGHGPSPKWTQQALQKRVAKNLRERDLSCRNGEIDRHAYNQVEECLEVNALEREGRERREVLLDELISMGNSLHCREAIVHVSDAAMSMMSMRRIGGQSLKEAVLVTRDNLSGENEQSIDLNESRSTCTHESWKDVRRYSAPTVGIVDPSTMISDRDKDLPNLVSLREFRRRKRGWVKKRGQSPLAAVACCASMIGDTVEAVRRTREDAAALAFKLAELHAGDAKALRATASLMRTHISCLHSVVQDFKVAWDMNGMAYPWQRTLKSIVVAMGLMSGALSIPRVLNMLNQLMFGSHPSPSTRKEKMVVAALVLCSGGYFGREIWQSLNLVQHTRKVRDAHFREQLCFILERASLMSDLANKDVAHTAQEQDKANL